MNNITYEIKLNDYNRPYIELLNNTGNNPEDKFYAIELARYIIQDSLNRIGTNKKHEKIFTNTIDLLYDIGDQIANILFEQMKGLGESILCFDNKYHFILNTADKLKNLPQFIVYEDRIFEKQNGLKCLIKENNKIFELKNNIWIEVSD